METARIKGIGTALPPATVEQWELPGMLPPEYSGLEAMRKIVAGSGISRRRLAVDPRVEDVAAWSTAPRMRRFQEEGLPLARRAVAEALDDAEARPDDVGLLCAVSSTGYASPGIDSRLVRDLGMGQGTERLAVGHMGCFAALPGLAACVDFARHRGGTAVLLNLELSSLHLQPPPWDTEQLVINSLFGDAAVAMVVTDSSGPGSGPLVLDRAAHTAYEYEEHMTWEVADEGFRMGLSAQIPDLIAARLPELINGLLTPHGVTVAEIDWWAIHPGGRRIVDAVEGCLALPVEATRAARRVLDEYGNCSSAGLPLVMAELQGSAELPPGKPGVAMTFGPGLTLYTALLWGT